MLKNKIENSSELLALRPKIEIEFSGEKNAMETFMHVTLRPVLKMQHLKLVTLIEQSEGFKFELCSSLYAEKNLIYLKNHLSKNAGLKQKLVGCVIGLLTDEEFDFYLQHQKEVNKRITLMIVERYLSTNLSSIIKKV